MLPASYRARARVNSRESRSSVRRRPSASARDADPAADDASSVAIIATGALRSMLSADAPSRSSNTAPRPAIRPPLGITPTVVMPPSCRATGSETACGLKASQTRNEAAMLSLPRARESRVSATAPTSTTPNVEDAATRPGVIHFPVASTRRAPAGTATLAPIAVITPLVSTIVAFSMRGPLTG